MQETIFITFAGRADGNQEVGVRYQGETSEAGLREEMYAGEFAAYTLVLQSIDRRKQCGMPVPASFVQLANERTFRDLL